MPKKNTKAQKNKSKFKNMLKNAGNKKRRKKMKLKGVDWSYAEQRARKELAEAGRQLAQPKTSGSPRNKIEKTSGKEEREIAISKDYLPPRWT